MPTQIEYGERIARQGKIRLGCSAVIVEPESGKILLTRRADNGQWCLPSGGVDPGESVAECIEREVWEETGLRGRALRLTGVYSDPNALVIYPDGNRAQIVALNFEMEINGGTLGLSDETTAAGYFSLQEMQAMDIILNHRQRVVDALAGHSQVIVA